MPHLTCRGCHRVSAQQRLPSSCAGSTALGCFGPASSGMWTVAASVRSIRIPPQSERERDGQTSQDTERK